MRRLLEADKGEQAALIASEETLESEFEWAWKQFDRADAERTALRKHVKEPSEGGSPAPTAEELAASETRWTTARDRLDLAIQHRRVVQQEVATLVEKIALEQQFLDELTGIQPAPKPERAPAPAIDAATPPPAKDSKPAAQSSSPVSILGMPGMPAKDTSTAKAQDQADAEKPPVDDKLVEAQKDLSDKQGALDTARQGLKRLDRAIDVFQRDLANSRQVLETSQKEVAVQEQALAARTVELNRKRGEGAPAEEITSLEQRVSRSQERLAKAKAESDRETSRVGESQAVLDQLDAAKQRVNEKVAEAEGAAAAAGSRVRFLQSPFSPHMMAQWVEHRGPRVAAVLVAMLVGWWLAKLAGQRLVSAIVLRGRQGTPLERQERAETLRRVFVSAAGVGILVMGTLAALNQAGIDVTVLLGGAAVLGAALAFGSQNLIKDYFAGFMILVENQYRVGNVVRIGDDTGTVEDITLRITVLRDLEGIVHFVPHSQVAQVSNLTYGWARLVFDIKVAPTEDPDKVIGILNEVARGLAADPAFNDQILGDPEMLGVDAFDAKTMTIKFLVKTRPLKRWPIKREMLRRVKKRFDEAGIRPPTA